MLTLQAKKVLITGGGRGIGRALAAEFTSHGAHPLLADMDAQALEETAGALEAADGFPRIYRLDLTDSRAVDELREQVRCDVGSIDVLVNNAGVVFGGAFLDVSLEHHFRTFQVNALGLVAVTRAFLPDLISRPESHLVNMASASGLVGLPFGSTYASSKWAVIGFSDSLRQELTAQGHHHVHVTTVCPGYVDTGLFNGARPPRGTPMLTSTQIASRVRRAVERNKAYVLTPWLIKITPLIRGILPTRLFDRFASFIGVSRSMRNWRGRDEG